MRKNRFWIKLILILPFVLLTNTDAYSAMTTNPFPGNPYFGSTHVSSPNQRPQKNVQQKNINQPNQNNWVAPYGYYPYVVVPVIYTTPNQVYQFGSSSNSSYVTTTAPETIEIPIGPSGTTQSASYPSGKWIAATGVNIPDGAIVNRNHPNPTYYCRALYNGQWYYGALNPDIGCNTDNQSVMMHFNKYEVLVGN